MKMPDIQSRNKIRDAKIISLALEGLSSYDIADWLVAHKQYDGHGNRESISSLVRRILIKNKEKLKIERDYEHFKQTMRIRRHAERLPPSTVALGYENLLDTKIGKKDEDQKDSRETKVVIIREVRNGDTDSSRSVSGQVSVIRV